MVAMIETWLTETFGLSYPVISAPMAGSGQGRLASAVSEAGGLGMVGVSASRSPEWLRKQAVVAATAGTPYGVGLMAWGLERDDAQLAATIDLHPSVVSVSFGRFEPYVDRLRDAGIRVTVQAGNVDDAVRAERAGADFVVARGAEGGGHGRNDMGTLTLLQAVLDRVEVPVVAAGGIATNILDDRAFLLPPFTQLDAARAIRSLRMWPMLDGYRGAARADTDRLEQVLVTLGELSVDVPEIAELDFNPVMCTPTDVVLVDVKVRVSESSPVNAGIPRQLRQQL